MARTTAIGTTKQLQAEIARLNAELATANAFVQRHHSRYLALEAENERLQQELARREPPPSLTF